MARAALEGRCAKDGLMAHALIIASTTRNLSKFVVPTRFASCQPWLHASAEQARPPRDQGPSVRGKGEELVEHQIDRSQSDREMALTFKAVGRCSSDVASKPLSVSERDHQVL